MEYIGISSCCQILSLPVVLYARKFYERKMSHNLSKFIFHQICSSLKIDVKISKHPVTVTALFEYFVNYLVL